MKMVSEEQNCTVRWALNFFVFTISVATLAAGAFAQDTGRVTGTISSRTGAAVAGAKVVITNKNTGETSVATTDAAGKYSSADLAAADYAIHVDARSFVSTTVSVTVAAGPPTTADIQLVPEPVPGVIPTENLRELPLNGRNFLQFLEFEPEAQIRDAGSIDPTKNGFFALSFGGGTGRATAITVDNAEIADRTVGTTTQTIPVNSIQEVRLGGVLGPISDQLILPGAVNFVTRSGGNDLHGDLFGFYRNGDVLSASLPGGHSHNWGRQQYGGDLGGAIEPDKLFFFLDFERNRQDLSNPVLLAGPFVGLSPASTTIREPFREIEATGRLDYQLSGRTRAFYRFNYDQNADTAPFGAGPSLQVLKAQTNTPSHTLGVDSARGDYTHALRFEYLKFENGSRDASANVSGIANPMPSVTINIGGGANTRCAPGSLFCSGPSSFAPQQIDQSYFQVRYDGTRVKGNHAWHFGASFNRILTGRFAALYSIAPALSDQASVPLAAGILGSTGFASDPLNYPVLWAFLGNGQGFASERSAFGVPRGGLSDHQLMLYGGDTWKLSPNLTITYGVHWVRDTGVSNSDLAAIPQVDAWGPGLGNKVRQPNLNFAPQLGVAWDASSSGKTILRGGVGMFYDESLFTNAFFDRPLRLAQGAYLATPAVCIGGAPGTIQWPNAGVAGSFVAGGAGVVNSNGTVSPTWCGQSMNMAGPQAVALQQAYQSATASAAGANPTYIGNLHAFAGPYENGLSLLAPNYQTPRTVQMNAGLQHELRPGLIFTVDYLRNVTTRTLLGVDVNHGGAASTFNQNNAIADRDAAQIANGCSAGPGQVNCMIAHLHSPAAALAAYGAQGIGGPAQVTGGAACPTCAFPGLNPNLGVNVMNFAEGRSVYSGVNVSLKQLITNFSSRQVHRAFFEFSYSHSHDLGQSADAGIFSQATDYVDPDHFTGPTALDRTHQVSIGAQFELQHAFNLSFVARFLSPLPATLSFQQTAGGAEVLVTDVTGDGTTGDLIPGTNIGSYMRRIKPRSLQNYISNYYNATVAGAADPATPAGNALLTGGVFSLQELEAMGGVMQPLAQPVSDVAGMGWSKTFDVRLGWEHHFGDHIIVTPSVAAFNILNFANFDLPGNTQSGILSFGPNSLSPWTTFLQPQNTAGGSTNGGVLGRTNRAPLGSGTSAAGAPRSVEFGLKIRF